MGEAGESFAAWWLAEQGLAVTDRNIAVDGGEIDLVASDGSERVVIEVRAITGDRDPIEAIDEAKRDHVRLLGRRLGASRVDFVGVGFRSWGVEIHWVPG